jgi:hypothetical protein
MSSISTALTTSVTIGSASYPSPLTITGTGSVKPAGTSGASVFTATSSRRQS